MELFERFVRYYIKTSLNTKLVPAEPNTTNVYSHLAYRKDATNKWRVINWEALSVATDKTVNAPMLPLLIAATFPECIQESMPYIARTLRKYRDCFFCTNFS